MSEFLDPTGRPTYGIGICGRCSRKFYLDELFDDPNTPGLKVCRDDMDEFDPYRLPARMTERIALPFTRPDVPLTFDINDVSNANRSQPVFLTGVFNAPAELLTWTGAIDTPASAYHLYRSVDGGSYALIAATAPNVLTYTDSPLDRFAHNYSYYVSYTDAFGVESRPSNIVSLSKISAILVVTASVGNAGVNTNAIRTSFDNGTTWNNCTTPSNNQYPLAAASSATRHEILAILFDGTILRSTDGLTWANLANNLSGTGFAAQDMIRVESLGLYIAVGNDGSLTTQRIATSPDGVTWTRRSSVVALTWQKLGYNSILGKVVCTAATFGTQPAITSPDGLTWTRVGVQAFSWEGYELAFSPAGRTFIGDRGNNQVYYSDDLVTYFNNGVSAVSTTSLASSPVVGGLVVEGTPVDIRTSLMTGTPSWTVRDSSLPYQLVEDLIYMTSGAAKFIGIKNHAGSDANNRVVQSPDGITWSNTIVDPQFPTTSTWLRIIEAII